VWFYCRFTELSGLVKLTGVSKGGFRKTALGPLWKKLLQMDHEVRSAGGVSLARKLRVCLETAAALYSRLMRRFTRSQNINYAREHH